MSSNNYYEVAYQKNPGVYFNVWDLEPGFYKLLLKSWSTPRVCLKGGDENFRAICRSHGTLIDIANPAAYWDAGQGPLEASSYEKLNELTIRSL